MTPFSAQSTAVVPIDRGASTMMRPSLHRLPAHLPLNKSVEEVVLARKIISQQYDNNSTSSTDEKSHPQRGILALPSSPASYLSHLPPESYVREVSSRPRKRPRSRVLRQATPNRSRHRSGGFAPQQLLRPLTGVSPPPTAQSVFTIADFSGEALRSGVRDVHLRTLSERVQCALLLLRDRCLLYEYCSYYRGKIIYGYSLRCLL